jgi:hypothetical protein
MKQTAVQSFWDNIALKLSFEQLKDFIPEFKKAKEMEEGQIALAYSKGTLDGVNKDFTNGYTYYKKTYK